MQCLKCNTTYKKKYARSKPLDYRDLRVVFIFCPQCGRGIKYDTVKQEVVEDGIDGKSS